jgi:hypothetical protein
MMAQVEEMREAGDSKCTPPGRIITMARIRFDSIPFFTLVQIFSDIYISNALRYLLGTRKWVILCISVEIT